MKALFAKLRAQAPSLRDPRKSLARRSPRHVRRRHRRLQDKWAPFGAELLPEEGTVLTHCNAGALATCGYGTALGVIRGHRARPADRRLRRRNPSLPARRAPHRMGADGRQHPHHRPLRQHGRQPHAPRAASRPSSSAPTASPPTATSPTRSAPTASPSSPKSTASPST
jgi:hypothetical protein